jgi:hypothetical protein
MCRARKGAIMKSEENKRFRELWLLLCIPEVVMWVLSKVTHGRPMFSYSSCCMENTATRKLRHSCAVMLVRQCSSGRIDPHEGERTFAGQVMYGVGKESR